MSESETNNDKRRDKRFIVLELEVYRQDTGDRFGKIINLSQSGMLIMRETPLLNESLISITIPLNKDIDNQIEFDADVKIVWARQNEISGFHSFGLEFVNQNPEQRDFINKMIDVFGSEET
ncbi:MAG: PilZ domain-containing protein [Chloroflexi bacterium]|nr:PilZ domain-containing protein [Chloroflexota bacterium]